jgi:RNA polymerase sigma-70 factor (ECF subfamily)
MDRRTHQTDEAVVQQVRARDKELYAVIIARYQEKLLRYAAYLVGDADMGADVVQESFIKAYINLNSFDTKKKFSSWMYRIVHNEAMNILKKQKNLHPLTEEHENIAGEVNIEDAFIREELQTMAHDCLQAIPVMYREPAALYYLDDKSYEEISEILRIPVSTVGTRISRAKVQLKRICQRKAR